MPIALAVGIPEPGGPEVLTVIERPVREPGEGEVRIAVAAAAVNPTDIGLRAMRRRGHRPAVDARDGRRRARSSRSARAWTGSPSATR